MGAPEQLQARNGNGYLVGRFVVAASLLSAAVGVFWAFLGPIYRDLNTQEVSIQELRRFENHLPMASPTRDAIAGLEAEIRGMKEHKIEIETQFKEVAQELSALRGWQQGITEQQNSIRERVAALEQAGVDHGWVPLPVHGGLK